MNSNQAGVCIYIGVRRGGQAQSKFCKASIDSNGSDDNWQLGDIIILLHMCLM